VIVATHDKDIVNTFRKRVIALENGRVIRDQDKGVYGYE
jgi:cell division transport system ATP-binding protein